MNDKKQIEELEKLQDKLIKRSCTEYNTKTSMLLMEASKAIGNLLKSYRKQSKNTIELPCKVGDKIYQTDGTKIYESTINEITLTTHKTIFITENIAFDETAIGKGIFLAKEEAEAKMKSGE